MVGAAIPNQAAAMQAVMFGGFLLVFMLSGLMFPLVERARVGLRWLSNFVWARYYIEIVRDAFLQGGGWPAVWYKVLAIAGIGSLFFTPGVAQDAPHAARGVSHGRAGSIASCRIGLRALIAEGAESDQARPPHHVVADPAADPAADAVRLGDESRRRQHPPRHRRRQPLAGRAAISIAALSESGSFTLTGALSIGGRARRAISARA